MGDAEDLALLSLPRAVWLKKKDRVKDREVVLLFLEDNEIRKGGAVSVAPATLWRMYAAWHALGVEGAPVRPLSFARQLRVLGFRNREVGQDRNLLVLVRKSTPLKEWEREHPEPPEFMGWYRREFNHGGSNETDRAKEAAAGLSVDGGEGSGSANAVVPDRDHEDAGG